MADAAAEKKEFTDKTLVCKDCNKEWVFSAGEQEFYAEKAFENEPTRCKECRKQRKIERNRRMRRGRGKGRGGERGPRSNVCYAFQRGECTRGDECKFSHTEAAAEPEPASA